VESWFTGVAGLKVVAPATPADAKGLLIAACEDGNPVLFLEHKWLYRSLKGPVSDGYYRVPIGRARLAREGSGATIVAYGVAVHWATEAADAFAKEGVSIEVVDLRSLLPWDSAMVLESVKKTGRCLVIHEAPQSGGFGGEVAAVVARDAFAWLDAPVERLGALDTPVPAAQALEDIFSPKARLLPALRTLLSY
jgi:2-oxoisovalerate dehydrogenase E1 component